ncbi:MAG: HAMP domain-containing histidine kinase [Lachnospiraceae bacterium]|nr:HAMP domain-containing histidine kinase [Lachnospiraceae bacterium]
MLISLILFGIVPTVITASAAIGFAVSAISSGADTETLAENFYGTLPVILLPVVLSIIGLAILISARLSFPLKKLADDVSSFSEGHHDKKLAINGSSEVWDIQDAINDMLEEMAQTDARRDEFVSNVSHELKTPLASMKVLSDSLLSSEDAPKEMYIEFLNDINSQIDRENKIISNLLTLVKITKKEEAVSLSPISVNELVENCMRQLKPLALNRNIEMTFESFRNVIAEVDEVKFSLVVTNLVENAIKYNKDNGAVKCSVNADHRFFVLKVEDSGVGIPADAKKRIFDRFYRVDKARSRETGGTGLGLSIVKEVVLMHHGSIKVTDSTLGGSLFTVKLPLVYRAKGAK